MKDDFHVGTVVIRSVVAIECMPHTAGTFSASEEKILPPSRSFSHDTCEEEVNGHHLVGRGREVL